MHIDDLRKLIMVVDDLPANASIIASFLQNAGHRTEVFHSGAALLEALEQLTPDLILLDVSMPDMDGFEVCRRLKNDPRSKDIPVLFLSALNDTPSKVKALDAGGIDYVTKPTKPAELRARVDAHLKAASFREEMGQQNRHLERVVEDKTKEVVDAQLAIIFALANLTENRDNETGKHVERVQSYSLLLAESLQMLPTYAGIIDDKFITNLYHATPLHDIGKVAIPDAVLLKPGRLTPDEFAVMQTHTVIGAKTLASVQSRFDKNALLTMGIEITRSHHERWDGAGYPEGLAGNTIPLAARIMSIADVYDALRSRRVYKPALSHEKACDILTEGAGTQFDPGLVQVFLMIESQFHGLSVELTD